LPTTPAAAALEAKKVRRRDWEKNIATVKFETKDCLQEV
jgi:hypothetical protein